MSDDFNARKAELDKARDELVSAMQWNQMGFVPHWNMCKVLDRIEQARARLPIIHEGVL